MINEETLTLFYYDDGLSENERRKVERALREDAVLAARYADLSRQLEQWSKPEGLIAPPDSVQRWHDSIDHAARAEQRAEQYKASPPVHFMSFFWGAAVTAALAIGIGIGFWFSSPAPVVNNPDYRVDAGPNVQNQSAPVSFSRGLQLHLQESQWGIASLPVDDDAQRALLALQLVEQNRFFERTATMNNSPQVARVLRAFEPVLMRLASDDISPEDAIALREKLAFELGVILTKLARETSEDAQTI